MKKKQSTTQTILAHVTIGIQLAITVLLGVLGGNWLDARFKTSPLFLAICVAVAMIIGFYHLMKQLTAINTNAELKSKEKRKKWN
jgi:F0F1-type ATP synthase assembly protein I